MGWKILKIIGLKVARMSLSNFHTSSAAQETKSDVPYWRVLVLLQWKYFILRKLNGSILTRLS